MRVKVINKQPASVLQKKRVCAYARVSTDSRRQEDSLENQMETAVFRLYESYCKK